MLALKRSSTKTVILSHRKFSSGVGFSKISMGGRSLLRAKKGAATICLTEAQIDFWDRVRIKWLAKKYGRHYLLDWAPTESLVRTWHTSEKFIICFMKVPAFLFLLL
jgi:hypothetical protein